MRLQQFFSCCCNEQEDQLQNKLQLSINNIQSPQSNSQIKLTLDSFTLLNVIGKGSFSKVILVRKNDDQKLYALKIIKKKIIQQKKQYERVMTERNILINTNNPFIIKHYSSFQNKKKLFFLLEYCGGGELFNLLWRKKQFDEELSKFYVSQIILGLEYLHQQNIVYRDLKPENVLLDTDGYIKLADFGLSKIIQENENMKSICGTNQYYAPELIQKKSYGKQVDLWTLGCLCFELINGKPPFQNPQEIMNTDIQKLCQCLNCSDLFKDLIIKLLERNFKKRIDIKQCKSHQVFENINWELIYQKKVIPLIKIQKKNEIDISHIDYGFLNENPYSYVSETYNTNNQFQGFSYYNNSNINNK
ncbi:protein kinase domain protein [Ichthyophthirius multifiliis]|uniref:Protein kinase domain protein n=1 Tax=Ichthyophthirius multifiliis TaxID=5932 RepID=G0QTA6_ICHMU|nr:protein kinase domain protein [Ichthyophthirius multifiliis]EGR31541.1 protein kinase domain protein [Ichthyophthirius multifiliis]|eukprot:XP_004035027.1 protein kinase domain protein [Ichthyophthirius multifiliis]